MGFWQPVPGQTQEERLLAQTEAFFKNQQDEFRRQAIEHAQQLLHSGSNEVAEAVSNNSQYAVYRDADFHHFGGSQNGGGGPTGTFTQQGVEQEGPASMAEQSVTKESSIPQGHPPSENNNNHRNLPPISGGLLGARLAEYDDEDAVVIVCGRCKATFHEAKLFVHHKAQELCFGSDENQQQNQQPEREVEHMDDRGFANETMVYNDQNQVASIGEHQNRPFVRRDFSDFASGNIKPGESTQAYTKLSTDFLVDEQEGEESFESVTGILPALNPQQALTPAADSAAATPANEAATPSTYNDSNGYSYDSTYTRIPESSTRPASATYQYWPGTSYNQPMRCSLMEEQVSLQGPTMGPPPRIESGFTSDDTNHQASHGHQRPQLSPGPPLNQQQMRHDQLGEQNDVTNKSDSSVLNPNGPWLTKAQQKSLQQAMSFASDQATPTRDQAASVTGTDADEWFTEQEREHIPSLLGLGEYIGPGSSWKTPVSLKPGVGVVLSGKFLPAGSSRYDKHFSFGLDLWDMTLPFSGSDVRQRALYINPIFSTKEIQVGSMIDETFVGVRHAAQDDRFPFRPGGKFTFAILCRDHGFKIWWKGTRGEGGTIYNYQYDVTKIKYLRVYDCHAIYIALGFRFL